MRRRYSKLSTLSRRESLCLHCLAKGYPRKQVAEQLSVEIDTIYSFIRRMKSKFDVITLQQVMEAARREKII